MNLRNKMFNILIFGSSKLYIIPYNSFANWTTLKEILYMVLDLQNHGKEIQYVWLQISVTASGIPMIPMWNFNDGKKWGGINKISPPWVSV